MPKLPAERMTSSVNARLSRRGPASAWTATPFSCRPYYPFALGNGSDCLVIGFTGSMNAGRGHQEEHQGLVTGWYKYAHRIYYIPERLRQASLLDGSPGIETGVASPVLQAGYAVTVAGEVAGVTDYRQWYDPRIPTVTTEVAYRDVRLAVAGYLTDEHLWVETIRLLAAPAGKSVSLALFLNRFVQPHYQDLKLGRESIVSLAPHHPAGALQFEYHMTPNDVRGGGYMWSRPAGICRGNKLVFENIQTGFEVTRWLLAMDDAETAAWQKEVKSAFRRLRAMPERQIRRTHVRIWSDFSNQSVLRVPDAHAQGLYDFSMYWMRANQYPKNGSLNLGPFPCHWGGGCNAVPDAWSMQMALLTANHIAESRRFLEFYRMRMPRARFVAQALGLPGARFCYFASAEGQDYHADPEKIRTEKVGANAMVCYSLYDHWRVSGKDDLLDESLGMMRELLDHIIAAAVQEKSDRAYIGTTKPSCECKFDVTNDTLISIWVTRALRGFCEMSRAAGQPAPDAYGRLAQKLPRGLIENYKNGYLMPFRNAAFHCGAVGCFFFNLPYGIDRKSVLRDIRAGKTPFGFDGDTYIGNIRHWPWAYCFQSLVYSHWGWDKKSFACLQNVMRDCSALGAMPEKIRIDGYPVNYYYTSPHAYFLWAFQTALCHDRKKDGVALLSGMDGTWRELEFVNLRMNGGLLVSLQVSRGRVRQLILRNDGARPLRRQLQLNPRYAGRLPSEVELPPGKTVKL